MIQVIDKWVVKVHFTPGIKPIEFIVNDNHYQNVLNHISKMAFNDEVFKIEIWLRKDV